MTAFDAVVLAGGAGSRLGGVSKAEVEVAGRALLDHVLAGLDDAAAVVVVGPPSVARVGVARVFEDPPGGGPVAGLAAGLARLGEGADLVAVLACDAPRAPSAIPALTSALAGAAGAARRGPDGARLVMDGRAQHLVALYRRDALDAALARLGDASGASMHALVSGLTLVDVPDQGGWGADADTWSDVSHLDSALRGTIDPMSQDPRRAPGADLPAWVDRLTLELGVDRALVDIDRVLDLASDVAHQVARPAVPVSLFVAGLAAAGGTPEDVDRILRIVEQHAAQWDEGQQGMITVRYFAAAAEAAGLDVESVAAGTAGQVGAELVEKHPALAGVLERCALLADGVRVSGEDLVPAGVILDILPPFAGG